MDERRHDRARGGKINLKNNGGATELCPGAQLVVTFTATTNNTAGTISWATEMTREFPEKQHFFEIRTQPTVILDNTAPTVTINQASGQADPTTVSPINFTAVFSEPVTGFATQRRHDHRHGRRDEGRHRHRQRPTTYNVAVTGMTSRGTVIASIPAGAAQDAATNPNTASTSTDNTVTWDRVPTATVSLSPNTATTPKTNDTLTATATKSDPDGDTVTLTYVWKNGATVVKTTTASASLTDTLDLSLAGNGDKGDVITVEVTPNDGLFNGSTASDNVTVKNTLPTVTLSGGEQPLAERGRDLHLQLLDQRCRTATRSPRSRRAAAPARRRTPSNTNTSGSFDCTFADGPASTSVSAQATDSGFGAGAGNNATQPISVQNVAPTVTLSGAQRPSVNEGSTHTYSYTISDPGVDTVTSVATRCGANGTLSERFEHEHSGSFDCTFPDGPASSTVSAQATDSDGDAGNTATQTVTVTNVAPTVRVHGDDRSGERGLDEDLHATRSAIRARTRSLGRDQLRRQRHARATRRTRTRAARSTAPSRTGRRARRSRRRRPTPTATPATRRRRRSRSPTSRRR